LPVIPVNRVVDKKRIIGNMEGREGGEAPGVADPQKAALSGRIQKPVQQCDPEFCTVIVVYHLDRFYVGNELPNGTSETTHIKACPFDRRTNIFWKLPSFSSFCWAIGRFKGKHNHTFDVRNGPAFLHFLMSKLATKKSASVASP
jgi:hypothetical protein